MYCCFNELYYGYGWVWQTQEVRRILPPVGRALQQAVAVKAGPTDNNLLPEYNTHQSDKIRLVTCKWKTACDFTV